MTPLKRLSSVDIITITAMWVFLCAIISSKGWIGFLLLLFGSFHQFWPFAFSYNFHFRFSFYKKPTSEYFFPFQTARQVCCCYSFLYGTHSMFFAEIFCFFPFSFGLNVTQSQPVSSLYFDEWPALVSSIHFLFHPISFSYIIFISCFAINFLIETEM